MIDYPRRRVDELTLKDIQSHAIWEYTPDEDDDETCVSPSQVPAITLKNKVVGTEIHLSCGRTMWGLLGNIDEENARANQHFTTLTLFLKGRQFVLARYHDNDYPEHGPPALAQVLNLALD